MAEKVIIRMPTGAEDEAEVRSPFSAKDIIKDAVPPGYRWWNKERRCWLVYDYYVQDLVYALNRAGFEVDVVAAPKVARQQVASQDWATATFATCATKDQVDSMHKALLKVHHPDKGGSPAMVEQINDAANKRRKQVY